MRRAPGLAGAFVILAATIGPVVPALAAVTVAVDDSVVVQKNSVGNNLLVLDNDTVAMAADISDVTDPAHGTAAIVGSGRRIGYSPDADYTGTDTFQYTVTDPADGNSTATVTVTVNAPPVAIADPSIDACRYGPSQTFALPEDKDSPFIAGSICNLLANDTDADGTVVNWELVTPPAHGDVTNDLPAPLPGFSTDFSYTPDPDYFTLPGNVAGGSWVSDSFTYRAIDDDGGVSQPVTVQFWIAPVNDAPTFTPGSSEVNGTAGHAYSAAWASAIDAGPNEGYQAVHFEIAPDSGNPAGLFSVAPAISAGGVLSFTAAAGQSGEATFEVVAKDDGGLEFYGGSSGQPVAEDTSDPVALTIVVGANTSPAATDDVVTVTEDQASASTVDVLDNDTDADDDALTVTAKTNGTKGTVTIGAGGGSVTYKPNANAFGGDTFTYTVSDGNGGTDSATVDVTITPVNDPPNAVNDGVPTAVAVYLPGPATSIAVLANDTYAPDAAETLSITAVTQGAHGTVAITGGGTGLTYTATGGTGIDVFTYTISDGHGGSDTASVQVNVVGDTIAPVAKLSLTKPTAAGRAATRVYAWWSFVETGSGLASQEIQLQVDAGAWVDLTPSALSTRRISVAISTGHVYGLRVRGTDLAGNVGGYATKTLSP